jgi:hypothetical protein
MKKRPGPEHQEVEIKSLKSPNVRFVPKANILPPRDLASVIAPSSELVGMPDGRGFPMRLTALVLATGLLWPASTFAQDEGASHPGFLNGGKIYEECASQDYSLCLGYVMGVSDALNATKPDFFCAPLSVKASQELAVVVKYLRDHPETWHYSAWTDIGVALALAFPCK